MLEATKYIKRLADTKGLNKKKAIVREAAVDGCTELFEAFQLAYTKRRVFNVKSVPVIEGDFTEEELNEPSDFNWPEFLDLVMRLETHQIEGFDARKILHNAAQVANIEDWNHFYRPILLKDMKCGVGKSTVNDVLQDMTNGAKQYIIPDWIVQKASKEGKIEGKKAVDPLMVGTRLLVVLDIDVGVVGAFKANGNSTSNFNNIISGLDALLPIMPIGLVLDGVVAGDRYALFDLIPLEDFDKGFCLMSQMDRHSGLVELQGLLQEHTEGRVYVLPKLMVDLDDEADRVKVNEFGPCVVKDPGGHYSDGVTHFWFERKDNEEL